MNLHIVPDNVFINKFYENVAGLGLAHENRIVVRTNAPKLKFINHDLPFARLYSQEIDSLIGNTTDYDKVFIHQFTPLLYRWVASHDFKELNWMVWGADLYNLPSVKMELYEDLTFRRYIKNKFSIGDFAYRTKVSVLHSRYRDVAYSKVRNVLTWMTDEYAFARDHLPALQADHQFFFYQNQLPYEALDEALRQRHEIYDRLVPTYIVGNSSTPELNHLDAISWMNNQGFKANLKIPVSYGDYRYAKFLGRALSFYQGGEIEFIDRYMKIDEYVNLLYNADGLIMNNVRPQGYGNIFMALYLGKKVFLNRKNLSIPELDKRGLQWFPLDQINEICEVDLQTNRSAVLELLSHQTLLKIYQWLFS